MIDGLYFMIQTILLLVLRIPLVLLGLIAVPIGLLFSKKDNTSIAYFTEHNKWKFWELETLPDWLWLWSNDRDGAQGDRRGWWDANCPTGDSSDFYSKFIWMAIRNPVNNMRFVRGLSCDVRESTVSKLAGQDHVNDKVGETGFMWLKAKGKTFNYYNLYWVRPNKKDPTKAFVVWIGHKVKLYHNLTDWSKLDDNKRWKGFTFRIGFNKDIS